MAQQFGSHMKFCATCNYWVGQRETDTFGSYSKVQDFNAKAKCMCPNGPWRNQPRGPMSGCSCYERWAVLRR
ncbi:MAG: hypothetical protein J6D23_07895 [Clostridia bacterium]|nr:hypothetical protein [Clostridia bacterium]